jgi:hypothetical protein
MDVTRFRSFAERYVIERASTFKNDTEMQDAWSAVERAKSIYKHIENVANVENDKDMREEHATRSQGMQATQGPPGATGMTGPSQTIARHPIGTRVLAPPANNSQSWTRRNSP